MSGEIEIWALSGVITDFEISSFGRVRRWFSGGRGRVGYILTSTRRPDGYITVSTRPFRGKKRRVFYVHRLVAEAFIGGPPFDGALVRHLNGQRDGNWPENLAWGSYIDNEADKLRHGRRTHGERCPWSKLKEPVVMEIRARHKNGENISSIARALGIPRGTTSHVVNGRTWRHLL